MNIEKIINWFKAAKPNPTEKDKTTQIGANLEAVSEMLQAVSCDTPPVSQASQDFYASPSIDRDIDGSVITLCENWEIDLLNSLCDQIVTAIGVGYMMGFDMVGALDEVNKSNWSKFKDGVPVFDENGKIAKTDGYFKPDLAKFLNKNKEL